MNRRVLDRKPGEPKRWEDLGENELLDMENEIVNGLQEEETEDVDLDQEDTVSSTCSTPENHVKRMKLDL